MDSHLFILPLRRPPTAPSLLAEDGAPTHRRSGPAPGPGGGPGSPWCAG